MNMISFNPITNAKCSKLLYYNKSSYFNMHSTFLFYVGSLLPLLRGLSFQTGTFCCLLTDFIEINWKVWPWSKEDLFSFWY